MTHPPTNDARDEDRRDANSAAAGASPGASPESAAPKHAMPKLPDLGSAAQQPATGWNGPGTTRPSYRANDPRANDPDANRQPAAYHPGDYAGQSRVQYGRPAPQQSADQGYGRPQAYRPPSPTTPASPRIGADTGARQPTTRYAGLPTAGAADYPADQRGHQQADQRGSRKTGRGARATVVILSLLLPIGILAGAVLGYTYASEFASYDTRAVEREVVSVLRDDYGLSDLSEVECPDWIKVEQGESFQCEFEYAGASQTVTVTQGAQSGQLVVGAPE